MNQYFAKPKKARSNQIGDPAWWYASPKSIEVHVDTQPGLLHGRVTIPRAQLVEYIKRTARKP